MLKMNSATGDASLAAARPTAASSGVHEQVSGAAAAPALLTTNAAAHNPQFLHPSPSKHSYSASEHYFSVASGDENDELPDQNIRSSSPPRFQTPPSRSHSPVQSNASSSPFIAHPTTPDKYTRPHHERAQSFSPPPQQQHHSLQTQPLLRSSRNHSKAAPRNHTIRGVAFDERTILPPAPSARSSNSLSRSSRGLGTQLLAPRRDRMENRGNTITPGVDDTPYIWFAIDQLTRDEEVRGSRADPLPAERPSSEETAIGEFPVHRAVLPAVQSSGSQPVQSPARRPVGSEEYRAVASPADFPVHTPPRRSVNDLDNYPVERILANPVYIPERQRERNPPSAVVAPQPTATQLPPRPPNKDRRWIRDSLNAQSRNNTFVPYYPTPEKDGYSHAPINFIPGVLRPTWLSLYMVLILIYLILLIFSAVRSPMSSHNGLSTYLAFGDGRYFVFQYLPTILGMFALLWLQQIHTAVKRMAPFFALADRSLHTRNQALFLNFYPSQFLLPDFQYFRAGQTVFGVVLLIFWLQNITIPLLASAFTVRFFGDPNTGHWRWVTVTAVIWTIVALYLVLLVALILLGFKVWGRGPRAQITGLRWDPRSLADLIALHERSNIMNDYVGSEIFAKKEDFRFRLANRTDRIGYWNTTQRPQSIFYGVGEEGGTTRRFAVEHGHVREKSNEAVYHDPTVDVENVGDGTRFTWKNMREEHVRRRYLPWYLKTTWVLAWILVAVVLFIAFIVVSFLNNAVVNGFSPALAVSATDDGFSAANFLYSFLPALLALLLVLLFQPLDFALRRLAPFAALSHPNGAIAEHSLLLDYPFRFPLSATVAALANKDYRLALVTLLSLTNTALPVLAGGLFWAQWYASNETARIAAEPSALYALTFFLALFVASLFLLIPGRQQLRLPHESTCLAELTSWTYMSNLLHDRQFARAGGGSKAELVTRLLGNRVVGQRGLLASFWSLGSVTRLVSRSQVAFTGDGEGKEYRYGFGVFEGRDGREHLGFERVGRQGL